jgi:hypothetical protein
VIVFATFEPSGRNRSYSTRKKALSAAKRRMQAGAGRVLVADIRPEAHATGGRRTVVRKRQRKIREYVRVGA